MGQPGMPPAPGMGMGGPANPMLQALSRLSGAPAPSREKRAMQTAAANLQIAMTGASTRSAKAAEHLSKAYQEVQRAIQIMEDLATAPIGPPPDFLGGVPSPMGQGSPAPML